MEQKQAIRFLVLSDTHDDAFPDPARLPEADAIIHCGDLTMIGGLSNYQRALESLASCPAEMKLVIAGNHDVSLDARWWDENLDSDDEQDEPAHARALFTSEVYTSRGVRYLDEGVHQLTLRDGRTFKVYASQYTPAFGGYAFGYNPEHDRFNTKGSAARIPDNENIDVVITHGPPRPSPSHLKAGQAYRLDLDWKQQQQQHLGCPRLWGAIERVKPKLHCFGHIHDGHGAQIARFHSGSEPTITDVDAVDKEGVLHISGMKGTTLLVNAAIMRHGEEEHNKPWLVTTTL
ncbi:unnamed protein product [Clonostachys rosea]|uniref:Calcineurin-like phosphoesterase domain-containing protein n=1 Tax=Bionectria ochroleuca TaxID=29856 RepID=A0ABY6UFD0_BIOOC|nr:unnamed protein product [Clonostachys rosea]